MNFLIQLDTRRNITQKKKADYEDYLEISSSIVSRKKNHSIGKLLFYFINIIIFIYFPYFF